MITQGESEGWPKHARLVAKAVAPVYVAGYIAFIIDGDSRDARVACRSKALAVSTGAERGAVRSELPGFSRSEQSGRTQSTGFARLQPTLGRVVLFRHDAIQHRGEVVRPSLGTVGRDGLAVPARSGKAGGQFVHINLLLWGASVVVIIGTHVTARGVSEVESPVMMLAAFEGKKKGQQYQWKV